MPQSNYQKYLSREDTQRFQILAGFFSILLGMVVAGAVIHFLPQDLSSLEKARQLGINGKTVLDGYPKLVEIQYYILGVIVSLFSGLSAFFALTYFRYKTKGTGPQDLDASPVYDTEKSSPPLGLVWWAGLAFLLLLVTFHQDFVYKNWYWGPWGLYFEEGIYLRWISELLRGKILYKDIYLQGGPFMAWPQYWLMKLFGPSISLNRYYAYFCYFAGYLIIFKVSRELIKSKVLMLICILLVVYFYYPMFPGFQQSLGRFAVSLLPLYFLYKFCFARKSSYLLVSGTVLGFALLSSQELGISSLVAVVLMLAALDYREGDMAKSFLRHLFLVIIGLSIPLLPVLVYFYYHHALPGLYEAMFNMPKYYMLGFGLPFPNILQLLGQAEKSTYGTIETLLAYWPIMFYIGGAFFCLALFLRKSFTNKTILFLGITTLGGMIFQRAFGIYTLLKIKNVLYPLIILSVAFLDMTRQRVLWLIINKNIHTQKAEIFIYLTLFVFMALGLYGYSQHWAFSLRRPPLVYRAELKYNTSFIPLNLRRAKDTYLPPPWAKKTKLVVEYIKRNTEPDEPIYVYPYDPLYYFLADRPSATKYPAIYTIPKEYREHVVRQLEKERVKWIIYIQHRPVLGVHDSIRYPEISRYIRKNYKAQWRFDDTLILKRKGY